MSRSKKANLTNKLMKSQHTEAFETSDYSHDQAEPQAV